MLGVGDCASWQRGRSYPGECDSLPDSRKIFLLFNGSFSHHGILLLCKKRKQIKIQRGKYAWAGIYCYKLLSSCAIMLLICVRSKCLSNCEHSSLCRASYLRVINTPGYILHLSCLKLSLSKHSPLELYCRMNNSEIKRRQFIPRGSEIGCYTYLILYQKNSLVWFLSDPIPRKCSVAIV